MISAELANRVSPAAELALRPALPEIADKLSLSGLVGQRVLAQIQSLLPNGSYQALINQRSVTLALPFAAHSGDAIELEVTESDGRLTLAVVANAASESGQTGSEATTTSLSRTGQLISDLLGAARDAKGEAKGDPVALPLNANQPIAARPPANAQELLPLLKRAITASGMFYESHQAAWVEGRYSKAQLLQEPQGKLAPLVTPQLATPSADSEAASSTPAAADTVRIQIKPAETATAQATPAITPQAQAIVQQQLEAFATENFAWQGQIWPGQQMRWEIENESDRRGSSGDSDDSRKWQTRLRLTLPNLGEIDARLHVQGRQMTLSMLANSPETRSLLRNGTAILRDQLEQAGLDLASLGVTAAPENHKAVPSAE